MAHPSQQYCPGDKDPRMRKTVNRAIRNCATNILGPDDGLYYIFPRKRPADFENPQA